MIYSDLDNELQWCHLQIGVRDIGQLN